MGKELKTVDIIRPGSLSAIIGPVGTLKRILKNREYFHSRGYDVSLFTSDSLQVGPIIDPPTTTNQKVVSKKSIIRRRIVSIIKMNARKNLWIAKWYIEKRHKQTEKLVDYYLSLNRTPDIIEFHSDYECQMYLKKRKDKKAKTVMFLHTDGIPFKMMLQYYPCLEGSKYFQKLSNDFAWTVSNADRIVFIARIGQSNFIKYFPNRSMNDTSVILNGIDDLSVEQKQEVNDIKQSLKDSVFKYRLCCTGTINNRKGHRIIIEAMHQMNKDLLKQVHVDFVGEGSERPVLEKLVKDYGLEENISFLGLIPNVDVYRCLAKNNIYILMSKNEGLPISIIEAMRAGLPIISTQISGIPELVDDGFNGFLLNPNVDELTDLLNKLPEYNWAEMGSNSRNRFVEEFTFERMGKEFCDMFDKVINC